MRIAMVAPLVESVPPQLYGGTERVVSSLTEGLVERGHDVTLFASGDSVTKARLVQGAASSLRSAKAESDADVLTLKMLSSVYAGANSFDVIHNHADWWALPFASLVSTPTLTTTHGRLDTPAVNRRYGLFSDQPLISIIDDQRTHLPANNWIGTVYNGIRCEDFTFQQSPGDYLVFLGRLSPEKRPDMAVEIARRVGMRLIVAAKADPNEAEYFNSVIHPLFKQSSFVDYIGEVGETEKDRLLGGAYANVFPIDWPEPFGLTMVESMATGTPVIAMTRGSVPEIVMHGETGFMCESLEEMVEAVPRVATLDRHACRDRVERLFSSERMVSAYEEAYRRLVGDRRTTDAA